MSEDAAADWHELMVACNVWFGVQWISAVHSTPACRWMHWYLLITTYTRPVVLHTLRGRPIVYTRLEVLCSILWKVIGSRRSESRLRQTASTSSPHQSICSLTDVSPLSRPSESRKQHQTQQ